MPAADPLIRALPLLRPRLPRLLLAIGAGVLSLGSALALAAVSAWLITRAWQMPLVLDLSVAVVAVRALGISRGVLHYCERLASHDTALRAATTARAQIYRRLADSPGSAALRMSGGDLAGRVGSDVDEVADVLVRAVLPIAVAMVLSVAAGRDDAAMLALEHAAELRVSGRLPMIIAEADQRQRDWTAALDRAAAPVALGTAVPVAAMGISVLGAAVAGIGLSATLAPTTVAILMLLPLSAFEATTALPGAAVALTRARIAARRLLPLAGDGGAPTGSRSGISPAAALRADALRVGHPGSRTGPLITALMTLAGLLAPHGGEVTLGGVPPASYTEPALRSAVLFFAEDAHLFATTVRDNLLVVRGDCTDDELLDALTAVGLRAWLDGLPGGLGTVLTGGADAVSAGQRRRLLLARALLSRATIVLLDEPTEHLDADSADDLMRGLLTPNMLFSADRTVVVATHHLATDIGCPRLHLAPAGYPGSRSSESGLTGVPSHDRTP